MKLKHIAFITIVAAFTGCAALQTFNRNHPALIPDTATLAKSLLDAGAAAYGLGVAAPLVNAGVDGAAAWLQGQLGKPMNPTGLVAATGLPPVANTILGATDTRMPIQQVDVNKLWEVSALLKTQ